MRLPEANLLPLFERVRNAVVGQHLGQLIRVVRTSHGRHHRAGAGAGQHVRQEMLLGECFDDADVEALAQLLADTSLTRNITANGSSPERCLAAARQRIDWHNSTWDTSAMTPPPTTVPLQPRVLTSLTQISS